MTLFSWARHPMLQSLMENANNWELNKSCLLSAVLDISKDPWVNAVTVWTWSSSSVEMVPPVLGLWGCKWIQVQVSNCSNVLPQGLWAVSEAQTDHVFVLPPLMTHCLERTFQSAHLLLAPSYQAVCELGHLIPTNHLLTSGKDLANSDSSSIHERSQPLIEDGNWQDHCQRKQLGRLLWVIRLLRLLSGQSSGSLKYLPATVDWDRLIPGSKWGGVRCMRWQRVRNKSWTKCTHCGIVEIMKMLQEKEKGGGDNLVWFRNVNSLGKKKPKKWYHSNWNYLHSTLFIL